MGAAIVPGKEFVADPEDADLELTAIDHLAVAVGVVGDGPCEILTHFVPPSAGTGMFCFAVRRLLQIPAVNPPVCCNRAIALPLKAGMVVTMAIARMTLRRSTGEPGDMGIRAIQTGEGWHARRKMTDIGVETF